MHATVTALAAEVQYVRTALGLSQNALAKKAGVDPTVLSKILNGKATAGPTETKLRAWLGRQQRALVVASGRSA